MSYTPWVNIEYDTKCVVATVIVEDEHLEDFPAFMKAVLRKNIGQDVGFFKIRFSDGVKYTTSLQELTKFINVYYSTPSRRRKMRKKSGYVRPNVNNQMFFRGLNEQQESFGYLDVDPIFDSINTTGDKNQFVSTISDCKSFENQSTCCLLALQSGENKLVGHYWETIKSFSYGGQSRSEDIQKLIQHASNVRHKYVSYRPSDSEESNQMSDWRKEHGSAQDNLLLYGAGIPLKNNDFPVTSKFNLSKLRTILDEYPIETPGLSYPYLYVGSTHASFPWHIEDQALFSINMLHFGAPCAWFFVPPKFYRKFVDWLHFMPLTKIHVSCHNVLGHKYVMASQKCLQQLGIPITTTIQKEKEILVTYPFAAHSGFKLGFNIQEAANFADEWWIEPGLFAPTCDCFETEINMDLKEIIAVGRPKLLPLYLQHDFLGLMAAVHKNPFLKQLDILPAHNLFVPTENDEKAAPEIKTIHQNLGRSNASLPQVRTIVEPQKVTGCRPVLHCPHKSCNASYKGGNGKVERLVAHINKCHLGCSDCIQSVQEKYAKRASKDLKSVVGHVCHVCGKLLAGSSTNLKIHIKKVHNCSNLTVM